MSATFATADNLSVPFRLWPCNYFVIKNEMMLKRFLFLSFALLITPVFVFAQQLEIKGSGNNFYLEHNVAPQENFYSIGRLYNISPRDLASYNRLTFDKGLNVGQQIKIPLVGDNFSQSTVKSAAEALVPLYHTVAAGETLYRLGVNYKNVDLGQLKEWNNLPGDNVNQGAKMIVGFLRVSKTESALAGADFQSASSQTVATASRTSTATAQRSERSVDRQPAAASGRNQTVRNERTEAQTPTPVVRTNNSSSSKSGFFAGEYPQGATKGLVTSTGTAAVFKSTSGWQDGKFYCFSNEAVPGSIVKVSIAGSPDEIYAKVLDAIPDIKQNQGLKLVLSNAAADALGVAGEKFEANIEFFK